MLFSMRKHYIYQLKYRKQDFFPAMENSICMFIWYQVDIPLVQDVTSLLEAKDGPILLSRTQARAQHPFHLPVSIAKDSGICI